MPTITIAGTPIEFPNSSSSPNWAEGVISFAEAVESALTSAVGPYDVPPQVVTIDAYNPGVNVDIAALNFPVSNVRAAFIRYSVFRTASGPSTTAYEAGTMILVYNPNGSTNNKWEVVRNYVGDASITFSVTDTGQVRFTTTQIGSTGHTGKLSFVAQALQQS